MSKSPLEMSDEELMNMTAPPTQEAAAPVVEDETDEQEESEEIQQEDSNEESGDDTEDETSEDNSEVEDEPVTEETEDDKEETEDDSSTGSEPANPLSESDENLGDKPKLPEKPKAEDKSKPKEEPAKQEDTKEADDKPKEDDSKKAESTETAVDYKAAYERLMAPIKASGKEIKLESVDEAIKLIQMGADYTKKLQQLHPQLKILRMLDNNQLLDEDKLNTLIDISKGDKGALHNFLTSKGIDPMDIDEESGKSYKQGNHKVSDVEIKFNQTLEDISSTPEGQSIIIDTQKKWDDASRKVMFADPEILPVLAAQKADGVYDAIVTEMEKRKILGDRTVLSQPFLHAYKAIGDDLANKGLLPISPKEQAAPVAQPVQEPEKKEEPQVVAKRTAPKKRVANGDKAKAASTTRSSGTAAAQEFNPLKMSDEEFLLQMANRLK